MNISIKTTQIDLTDALNDHVEKRITSLNKVIDQADESVRCQVEIGRPSAHHRHGDVYRAECNVHIAGKSFYADAEGSDLYAAIDQVRDELMKALRRHKNKKESLMRKGGLKFKQFIRGFRHK